MNHDGLRGGLVSALTDACAPAVVADEEPELVTSPTVVVCWIGTQWSRDQALSWVHGYEVRIILPRDPALVHFAERDRLVKAVFATLAAWSPGASRHPSKPAARLGTATVGTSEHRAVLVTTNVHEPYEE